MIDEAPKTGYNGTILMNQGIARMIGLIGAMAVEVEALEKKLEGRRETTIGMDTFVSGKLFGQDAVLAVCGPGKVNAAVCTQKMITAFSPDWVLNLGVAGAGADGVRIGDLVAATAAVQHDADTSPGRPGGHGQQGEPRRAALRRRTPRAPCGGGEKGESDRS